MLAEGRSNQVVVATMPSTHKHAICLLANILTVSIRIL